MANRAKRTSFLARISLIAPDVIEFNGAKRAYRVKKMIRFDGEQMDL